MSFGHRGSVDNPETLDFFSPVKTNGDFEFLVLFACELSVSWIVVDISFVSASIHIIIVRVIIVVGVVLMNNVEIIL